MAVTHNGSGRSRDMNSSNEITKVQWTSVEPEGAMHIDMALAKHYGRADTSETDNKTRVDAGSGTILGIYAVASVKRKIERSP
jgi:hypothetical protein